MLVGASSAVGNHPPNFFETVLWNPALCVSVHMHVRARMCVLGPVTLRSLMECSLPGSSVHGPSRASILEWATDSCSSRSSWCLTQGSNLRLLCLLDWQAYLLPLRHLGSPWSATWEARGVPAQSVQSLMHVGAAATWTVACQSYLAFTSSQSLLKFLSVELVMLSEHLILCRPLLLPLIFPSIRVFSNESALCIRWQSIGASTSASILPMNIQDWFPLGLSGLIS